VSASGLALEQVALHLGAFRIASVDLAVEPGEVLVLLGPNGAGKSVTLEAIAGFHRLDAGRILLGARDITDMPPERRRISLLFQNFALFPHLSAAGNVALALRAAGLAPALPRITELLARFGVAPLADRLPELLSPGEKQRVALARALAGQPELFLFDEPFSALDAPTRAALRDGLKEFLRQAGAPSVFVTHDPVEALALADRLALLRDGAVIQSGAAADVYRAPADRLAARLLGVENILPVRLVERAGLGWRIAVGEAVLELPGSNAPHALPPELFLCLRAEDVALAAASGDRQGACPSNRLAARVTAIRHAGALLKVSLDCGFPLVAALTQRDARALDLASGIPLIADIDPLAIRLVG
jgi:ABC-type Fe3+/spermidine/putrescine transport system ATPase subunit